MDLPIVLADHLLKTKNEYKNLKKQERYNYQNKVDKACFQRDMAYGGFQDLPRRTQKKSMLKLQNMMNITADLFQWFINFLIKRLLVVLLKMKLCETKN